MGVNVTMALWFLPFFCCFGTMSLIWLLSGMALTQSSTCYKSYECCKTHVQCRVAHRQHLAAAHCASSLLLGYRLCTHEAPPE
jgi:hypothetical protein